MEIKNFSDAGLISYLSILGFKHISYQTSKGRTSLQFESCPEIEKAVADYYSGVASVDPHVFVERFLSVRQMLREVR